MRRPDVSIVVPAYNAAATLAETLASVRAQTFEHWEAVIVDDGSTDDTAAVATQFGAQDSRLRLLRQPNGGHSAARNAAIRASQGEWLVCLDSDDWVAPQFLDVMMRAVAADPGLDAVVCGCVRVAPSGEHGIPATYTASQFTDPFPAFALDCPIAIHSCMVRRSLAQTVGGFDTSLGACVDWDFWQRVARTGARFGTVPEVLAFYRMRPGSVSTGAERALRDGWTVIRRAHAKDLRVPAPDPRYADGLPAAGLPEALFRQAVWAASIVLASGKDARPIVALMGEEHAPSLAPAQVAHWLFDYVPFASSRKAEDWPALWPQVAARVGSYLAQLEVQSGASDLARESSRELERLIAELEVRQVPSEAPQLRRPLWKRLAHGARSLVRGARA